MKVSSTLAVLLVLGTFASCNQEVQKAPSDGKRISISSITSDSSLSPKDKAEKLALAGEQLVTLTGFMYAGDILDQALVLDPQNKRAQFYKALLSAPLRLEGILTRIRPMVKSNPESQKSYDEVVASIPEGGLKKFLFNGKENIRSEKDVQGFLDEIYGGQDKLRSFLKSNKNIKLTLNLNDVGLVQQSFKEALETCAVEQVGNDEFDIRKCDLSKAMQLELNRADMESLQHITAGMQIYTLMYNSYDLSGTIKVSKNLKDSEASTSEVWSELTKNSAFGKVRNPQFLKAVPSLGLDVISGVRWAISMQDKLCPNGEYERGVRKGFLFSKGLCISDNADNGEPVENVLKVLDVLLAGQSKMFKFASAKGTIEADVKPAAFFNNPIKDLKSLKPEFNDCGQIVKVADSSFGGILPNREGNRILEANDNCAPSDSESTDEE